MTHKFHRLITSSFLALAVLAFSSGPQPVRAAGPWFVSTTGNNVNDCLSPGTPCATINEAIYRAGNGDTIYVAIGIYTDIGREVVLIDKDIALLSGGWDESFSTQSGMSTIDGQATRRGISIAATEFSGPTIFIERFKVQNGKADGGGGINNNFSNVALRNLTISNNTATSSGGGIANGGILTLNNSIVNGNTSAIVGGGIINYNGLTSNNSTIYDNTSQYGAGILLSSFAGTLILNNSTISGNRSVLAGGGFLNDGFGLSVITLRNTIVAGNMAPTGADCSSSAGATSPINSAGYNLIGDLSNCNITPATGDLTNTDPLLGSLQDNGGPTFTLGLSPGSPAIDAGNPAGCTDNNGNLLPTDQRGVTRPQGTHCDIGAFELQAAGSSIRVTIDIKPGSQKNPINTWSMGRIPVAILSTPDFDAPSKADRNSLTFGRTGDEMSLVSCNKKGEDVNGDGLLDLVCHFKTKLTGFEIGDVVGILKGKTVSGALIQGQDTVKILK